MKQTAIPAGYAPVMTNSISMRVNEAAGTLKPRIQPRPVDDVLGRRAHPAFRQVRPVIVSRPHYVAKAPTVGRSAWASPLRETFTEKLLYFALALSALAGIAYCFISVLERVQNWPIFNAWVSRVIGA